MKVLTTLILTSILLSPIPAVSADTRTWTGKAGNTRDWHVPGNWSDGIVPGAAGDRADVVLPGGLMLYPVLTKAAAVGGSLFLRAGAALTLGGHSLTVGTGIEDSVDGKDTGYTRTHQRGLILDKGSTLVTGKGAVITLRLGGLFNRGKISNAPALRFEGGFHHFLLDPGGAKLSRLFLGESAYPYQVILGNNLEVTGNVELTGGELLVQSGKTLAIKGDLLFRGRVQAAALSPRGEVKLYGTIRSQGASCYLRRTRGWVSLVGGANQTIVPGGVLPPLKLSKPTGKVTPAADLHCAALAVDGGNTLDLSKGQKLIFGVDWQEWMIDPADKMVISSWRKRIPVRGSIGLINQGKIIGTPGVPFVFHTADEGSHVVVHGKYFPAKETGEGVAFEVRNRMKTDLSINIPGSRLTLKKGKVLLDGKAPHDPGKDDLDLELDYDVLGDEEGEVAAPPPRIDILKVATAPESRALKKGTVDLAPFASAIYSVPSIGTAIFNLVDKDPKTLAAFRSGVGIGGQLEFVFPAPVRISAIRLFQARLFATRYVIYADTTGDGTCNRIIGYGLGGGPWRWSSLRFPDVTLHRLKFRSTEAQFGWETSSPILGSFEIYGDQESATKLEKLNPVLQVDMSFGPKARFTEGKKIIVKWSDPAKSDRILKLIEADLWHLGIGQKEKDLPKVHLKEYPQCQKVLDDVKAMGADGIVLFIEAGLKAFWPSRNFHSITNEKYFERQREKARPALDDKPPEDGDELEEGGEFDLEEGDETAKNELDTPSIAPSSTADLPSQRDLLKELCGAAHEKGLKVYVKFLGNFMKCYIGPKDQDAWQCLMDEVASRPVDGISITADEAYVGLARLPGKGEKNSSMAKKFKARFGPESRLPKSIWDKTAKGERIKKYILFSYERSGQRFQRYCQRIRERNPKCAIFTNIGSHAVSCNNRITYGLAYDVIGHIADIDYFGTDYMASEVRTWVAASKNRRAASCVFTARSVREGLQSALQGARLVSYYRYNYIEMQKSRDHRVREFAFMRVMERAGLTRAPQPKALAVLNSRAAEDWWDNKHGTIWLGWSPTGKQGFWTSRLVNQFLLAQGYPFELYSLDHPEDLKGIGEYKVIFLPFPYAVTKQAARILKRAHANGSRILIAQKQGEVNEVGQAHKTPLLASLIEAGQKDGSVVFIDQDLVKWETERSFSRDLGAILDRLLGKHKPVFFAAHGRRVEIYLHEETDKRKYLTLINWEDKPAEFEVGINLPQGSYRILTVSTDRPKELRTGKIAGKETISSEELKRFGMQLMGGEVRLLYVVPNTEGWVKAGD